MNIKKNNQKIQFPDPRLLQNGSEGLIFVGGNLEIETLVKAYRSRIYPWPYDPTYPILWFCPEPRGILDFADFHIPKSLQKFIAKKQYTLTVNKAFTRVIEECAKQKRPNQDGTWIIPQMLAAYTKFHEAGYAHSVECWDGDRLVGGLYGVFVDGLFSGESMFYLEPNTSKICFVKLVELLKKHGSLWMDIQMTTPVTELLGGKYITRADFLKRLDVLHTKNPEHKIKLQSVV